MTLRRHFRVGLLGGLAFAAALAAGCRGSDYIKPRNPVEHTHILKMAALWSAYYGSHAKKPPDSTKQLTEWVRRLKPDQLKKMGIENLDDVLISPRDHEPYQVVPNPQITKPMGMAPAVVYEKVGVGGKHLVAGNSGNTSEMNDEGLRNLGVNQ